MKDNKKNILIILVIAILIMIPMFLVNGYIINDDSKFHIANILSTVDSMKHLIPNDVLPNLFGNYGIAIRQFYPTFAHTFIALFIKITTLDVTISLKIFHLLELFLSGISMYYLALRLSKDKKLSLVSSVIYMLFPYHLTEIYVRDALGESLLFIALPLIINGLTYLFNDKKKFLILFCFGYILGMLSHLTMMIYFTFFLIPFFLINIKKIFKKDTLITLIEAALIILLVMSPTIVNLFQNKLYGDYRVFTPYVMAQGIVHSGLWLDYINYFGIFDKQIIFNDSLHKFYIDIIVLIMLLIDLIIYIRMLIKKKKINLSNDYIFLIIFGILSFYLATKYFPWDMLPVSFRILQFPWRIETFLAISVSIIAPLCLKYVKDYYKYIAIILMVVLALLFNTGSPHDEYFDSNNIDYEMGIGWQKEYLPNKTYDNLDYVKSLDYNVITSNGTAKIVKDDFPNITFEISENTKVELPRIFYFGYELVDSNNNKQTIYDDEYGLIGANLNKGVYTLKYTKTNIYKIAKVISYITLLLFVIYIFKNKIISKNK